MSRVRGPRRFTASPRPAGGLGLFVARVAFEFVISKPQNQVSDPLTMSVTGALAPSFPSSVARSPAAGRTTIGLSGEPVQLAGEMADVGPSFQPDRVAGLHGGRL